MKPQGQWERMVTLFLGLCRAAGMDVKDAPPQRPGRLDSPREPRGVMRAREARAGRRPGREAPSSDGDKMRWHIEGQGDHRFFNDMVRARQPSQETLDPAILAFLGKLREIDNIEALDAWYDALKPLFAYVLATRPKATLDPEETAALATT